MVQKLNVLLLKKKMQDNFKKHKKMRMLCLNVVVIHLNLLVHLTAMVMEKQKENKKSTPQHPVCLTTVIVLSALSNFLLMFHRQEIISYQTGVISLRLPVIHKKH